jgi:hypothetical protein
MEGIRNIYKILAVKKMKKRDHFGDLDTGGRILLS